MTLPSSDFAYVADLVRREAAIVLTPNKDYLVQARLLPVAQQHGLAGVPQLVQTLRGRPDAQLRQQVVEALTTNETSWFRDNDPYKLLGSTVLPEVTALARSQNRPVRIWSAACSTGQEPYSIAIVLRESLPTGLRYEMVASDFSQEMVARAQAGRFSQLEMNRGLAASLLVKYFDREGAHWRVGADLRRDLSFTRINLAAPFPALGMFDVVFVRNVLIYFDVDTKRGVLERVRRLLRPGGWLFLGAAETTMGITTDFTRADDAKTSAYRLKVADKAAAPASAAGMR
jgi:chemotaxis protein methyltransferase CheR